MKLIKWMTLILCMTLILVGCGNEPASSLPESSEVLHTYYIMLAKQEIHKGFQITDSNVSEYIEVVAIEQDSLMDDAYQSVEDAQQAADSLVGKWAKFEILAGSCVSTTQFVNSDPLLHTSAD